ncbi:hypothetical protein K474DRAFT_1449238 [Panus rudis PR-1116 ss-1]|nr:hypothetical protein K474DRAFT_1449238 [Panus rudis PR-1116 ss-1]
MTSLDGLPSRGDFILVTDQLLAPADFWIHRAISAHLEEVGKSKCLYLSARESVERLKSKSGKSRVNLAQQTTNGNLVFVEINSQVEPPASPTDDHAPLLKPLLDIVKRQFEIWSQDDVFPLVVIDDISVLEWTGFTTNDIVKFLRALAALCRKNDAGLVVRHHVLTPAEPDDILRILLQLCSYHLEVLPLSTGRSGSVSGQVALYPGPGVTQPAHKPIPRQSAIQYRLTDAGCMFFQRGTGSTVL